MMNDESNVMNEIRKIRAEISREMKEMSPEEHVAVTKADAKNLEKEFGLDLPRLKRVLSKS
jgi:hypothetical protein